MQTNNTEIVIEEEMLLKKMLSKKMLLKEWEWQYPKLRHKLFAHRIDIWKMDNIKMILRMRITRDNIGKRSKVDYECPVCNKNTSIDKLNSSDKKIYNKNMWMHQH